MVKTPEDHRDSETYTESFDARYIFWIKYQKIISIYGFSFLNRPPTLNDSDLHNDLHYKYYKNIRAKGLPIAEKLIRS